jgi:hypothetical protein
MTIQTEDSQEMYVFALNSLDSWAAKAIDNIIRYIVIIGTHTGPVVDDAYQSNQDHR